MILLLPIVGLPLFLLIGSPYIQGRRHKLQADANELILERTKDLPALPAGVAATGQISGVITLNRNLGSLPCGRGNPIGLYPVYGDSIAAMTEAVHNARSSVNFEIYILALDDTTAPFFDALGAAARRGVTVRVLYDHIGPRGYPGFKQMNARLTADGIDWHQMLPIKPLRGRWRRPDLRNHRKLLVVDEEIGFMGSQNMIDSSYLKPANLKVDRHWHDLNVGLTGTIVAALSTVFAFDWFTETGQVLDVQVDASQMSGEAQPCSCCRRDQASAPNPICACSTP